MAASPPAAAYAIRSRAEAVLWEHHALGPTFRQIVAVVWQKVVDRGHRWKLLGQRDHEKLVPSLTLLAGDPGHLGAAVPVAVLGRGVCA